MESISHRFVATHGIDMHVAEVGTGPNTVLFLHGFPEIWYSWRHQMLAVADAGFRAIAPDLRGYGLTCNTDPTKNTWVDIGHDIVGLLDAIGADKVYVVAKDWGAFIAYYLGYTHSQRIQGLIILGIPFFKPTLAAAILENVPPGHYLQHWAKPGVPEADFARFDVATVIKRIYILFCNSEMPIALENMHTLDLVKPEDPLPNWMTDKDLQVYADHYEKSTFEYPMEVPYRCWDRAGEDFDENRDYTIRAPILLVMGKQDYVLKMPGMEHLMQGDPSLLLNFKLVTIEEGNHFVQEQLPQQVNGIIISFLDSIKADQRGAA